jgi:hypothetical protein
MDSFPIDEEIRSFPPPIPQYTIQQKTDIIIKSFFNMTS